MVIGIDIRSLLSTQRTGVGEYAHSLLQAIFEEDKENTYVLFYNSFKDVSSLLPKWEYPNVHFVGLRWPNKFFNLSTSIFHYPKVDSLIRKKMQNGEFRIQNADYFFSPNPSFTALSPGVKHILTIHDLSTELLPDCYFWKQRAWHRAVGVRRQCASAHRVVVPSENTKRDVVRVYGVPEKNVAVLYPSVSTQFAREPGPIEQAIVRKKYGLSERYILFLGAVEPRKNISGVLDAFALLQKKSVRHELVIAGARGWKNGDIMKRIQREQDVRYLGYVLPEEKPALYAGASAFVYPSLYEGFGLPVLEAMSMGVPVITSNRSSLPEVTGDAAYLVNPYDSADIARGMERILTDTVFADTLRERGRKRAAEFSWQKTAQEFLSLL